MTRKEICIEIWRQLAETGSNNKASVSDNIFKLSNRPLFAVCAEAKIRTGEYGYNKCKNCPVRWIDKSNSFNDCVRDGSPYNKWIDAKTVESRKHYAKQVLQHVIDAWEDIF